ncbi:MAG: ATP-grasp domain-containing protein [Acidimicrobiales bacterium]
MHRVLLLVPSASYRASDFLEAARTLGIEVIVGCEEPPVIRASRANVQVPLYDPVAAVEAIVALDSKRPLDAVVAVDDQGSLAAARACERLGLRSNSPGAVAAARDKLAMRSLLSEAEVPQPAFAPLPSGAGPYEQARLAEMVGLPCVLKPTSLSASQGVIRANTIGEVQAGVSRVRAIAASAGAEPGEPILIERFVPGPEVAVEAMLTNGELSVLAIFDKPDPLEGPYFEETLYVTPSRLDRTDLDAVEAVTKAAARALGLSEGPLHAELRVDAGRAFVIEVAARSIGGLCSRTLKFGTGTTLEHLILAHALGRGAGSLDMKGAAGVLMLPIGTGGTLLEVTGQKEALSIAGIAGLEITIAPGRPLVPLPEGNRYLGFVFARGETPEEVEAALRAAMATLRVRVRPAGPLRHPVAGR